MYTCQNLTDYMAQFFEGAFPRVRHNFVLATHNSDSSAPATFGAYLDDPKLLAWYAMNPDIVHPKLVPMPIGFANTHWPHGSPAALQDAFDDLTLTLTQNLPDPGPGVSTIFRG